MKNITTIVILLLSFQITFAQQSLDWSSMKPDQRKEAIRKMEPKERVQLLRDFREKMVISELNVAEKDQAQFSMLYSEYQSKQNEIKSKFKADIDYDNMSDAVASKQLEQSFEVGQQLLDNRKNYAKKFTSVISPQQVLKMYQTEGKMRNKIMDRKEGEPRNSRNSNAQSRQPR